MLGLAITLSTPQSEMQWEFIVSHFCPDRVELLGDVPATGKEFLKHTAELPADTVRVFMSPPNAAKVPGTVPLNEFEHPENALYIFGSDNRHTEEMEADHYVYIPSKFHPEMYSWVAGAITLWDREHGKSDNRQQNLG